MPTMTDEERKRTAAALREPSMYQRVKGFFKSIPDPRETMRQAQAAFNQRQQGLTNKAIDDEEQGNAPTPTPYSRNR